MKKIIKITAFTLAFVMILSGICAVGSKLAKQIDIYFRNIKININGDEILEKQASGLEIYYADNYEQRCSQFKN